MAARISLNLVDRVILPMESGSTPWSTHFEIRVPGRLDPERLAAAASAATARHPLARARLAHHRVYDRDLFWDIAREPVKVPLDVVACRDDAEADAARLRLLDRAIPLSSAPPFALLLAQREGGDSLVLNLNHVAGDGVSGFRLLRSIARGYAGVDDGSPTDDHVELRDLRGQLAADPAAVPAALWEGRPRERVRLAIDGGTPGATGYGVRQVRFDHEQTARIRALRQAPATTNDVLLGAVAVAVRRFNEAHDAAPGTVSIQIPLNLRPPEHAEELIANIIAVVSLPVFAEEQGDLTVAQQAVARRTQVLKAARSDGLLAAPPLVGTLPAAAIELLSRLRDRSRAVSRLDTTIMSNVGRMEPFDFGPDAGASTEVWVSPPQRMPRGAGIAIVGMNDELFLTVRYLQAQFDDGGADRFVDELRDTLLAPAVSAAGR